MFKLQIDYNHYWFLFGCDIYIDCETLDVLVLAILFIDNRTVLELGAQM